MVVNNPKVSIIAAISLNYALGKDNKLLYHIKEDMEQFKNLTTGHIVIMGRKTYESLPKGALPNRTNIVISRYGKVGDYPGCILCRNYEFALQEAAKIAYNNSGKMVKEIFVIGGGMLYAQALDHGNVARMFMTVVNEMVDKENADTWFPEIDPDKWTVANNKIVYPDNDESKPWHHLFQMLTNPDVYDYTDYFFALNDEDEYTEDEEKDTEKL